MVLVETDKLCLSHNYECITLFDKEANNILFVDDFYGDPTCALIDSTNKYVVVARKHLTLWTRYQGLTKITEFETKEFCWIERLRLIDRDNVQILLDPWFQYSAIWQLTISDKLLLKICDFTKYRNLSYTDNIIW